MITTYLREVHYRLAIMCNLCKPFASMSTQSIFDHHSGCKARHVKKCTEQEGHKKEKKWHKKFQGVRTGKNIPRLGQVALKHPEGLGDAQHSIQFH